MKKERNIATFDLIFFLLHPAQRKEVAWLSQPSSTVDDSDIAATKFHSRFKNSCSQFFLFLVICHIVHDVLYEIHPIYLIILSHQLKEFPFLSDQLSNLAQWINFLLRSEKKKKPGKTSKRHHCFKNGQIPNKKRKRRYNEYLVPYRVFHNKVIKFEGLLQMLITNIYTNFTNFDVEWTLIQIIWSTRCKLMKPSKYITSLWSTL